jgi:hypothetical protein
VEKGSRVYAKNVKSRLFKKGAVLVVTDKLPDIDLVILIERRGIPKLVKLCQMRKNDVFRNVVHLAC